MGEVLRNCARYKTSVMQMSPTLIVIAGLSLALCYLDSRDKETDKLE